MSSIFFKFYLLISNPFEVLLKGKNFGAQGTALRLWGGTWGPFMPLESDKAVNPKP